MQKRSAFKLAALAAAFVALVVGAAGYAHLGLYNIAADEKHWALTERVMQTVRTRSIEARARDIREVPNLEDPKVLAAGAREYAEMCAGCHLAPGVENTSLRRGLYPQPPSLAQQAIEPRTAFWVIKHGIKMSGMPAWGETHDDATLWSIVAFLQKLPGLDTKAYEKMTADTRAHETMPEHAAAKDKAGAKEKATRSHSH